MKTGIAHLSLLRRSVSVAAMMAALLTPPVAAQTAGALLGSVGMTAPVVTAPVALVAPTTPNAAGLASAGARALANQAQLATSLSMAQQAQAEMRAAASTVILPTGVAASAGVVPNGLVAGGLVRVENPTDLQIAGGLAVWQGAAAPTVDGNVVTIAQQASRALLSWSSFNVGRETTVNFVQQPDWVVVNRIVGNLDPVTGALATNTLAPSTILGRITGAGTVVVINQNGVMFGNAAQVAVRSFLASSLELGAPTRLVRTGNQEATLVTTLVERNASFLQTGLLTGGSLVSTVAQQTGPTNIDAAIVEGDVTVAGGARITGGDGGFVIIAAPRVVNGGTLSATNGQVSLVAGRRVSAQASSGAVDSIDPNVRGLVLTAENDFREVAADVRTGGVTNSAGAIIDSPRGLISLGATANGTVTQNGILTSTTSVSRNGKIALTGATVSIGAGSRMAITPDGNGETIPQAADSVAGFKTSIIDIGFANSSGAAAPSNITIGAGALIYAPGATANIGGTASGENPVLGEVADVFSAFSVVVDAGATIDVSGVKNLELAASRNSITITPVKRTELRDTPNYREVSDDPDVFTLNGTTLTVDARLSGVRADGVAWVGSPLLEAAGALGQVGVTAPELLTRGGTLTLGTRLFSSIAATSALGSVTVRPGATLDVSGGWVRYAPGIVETSRLLTADGRIVDIGSADPNDRFVGIAGPITAAQDRFGIVDVFGNPLASEARFEAAYVEGRDAGALVVKGSTNVFGGTVFADAFAGTQQIARAREGSVAARLPGDTRTLQATPFELPTGGFLSVRAITSATGARAGGADIVVHAVGSAAPARSASEIVISDRLLSGSGFAAVALATTGRVSLLAGSSILLAPNGGLSIDAGRSIRFDGSVTTPSGTIAARTYQIAGGSVFRSDDDLALVGLRTPGLAFDITVTGQLLARGRFTNDALVTDGTYLGTAFADGGSISLTVAPRVLLASSSDRNAEVIDASGSIFIEPGALLDVTAGGSIRTDGTAVLTARGGSVALVNQTNYFQLLPDPPSAFGTLGIDLPTFVSPDDTAGRIGTLSPDVYNAQVRIASDTIRAQGFTGGGTFTLVTPDLDFGDRADGTGTVVPLDFISTTGFASYEFQTYTSRVVKNVFAGVRDASTPLLDTETVEIRAGETLSLSRAFIPSLQLGEATLAALAAAPGNTSLAVLLGSGQPADLFDQRGVAVNFSGLTEVVVRGRIEGADGASLTSGSLLNAAGGVILLPGGTLRQTQSLPSFYLNSTRPAIAVKSLDDVFGAPVDGKYVPTKENVQQIRATTSADSPILTNAELVSQRQVQRAVYFLGELGVGEGVRLEAGSFTDLSGASIRNPRGVNSGDGSQRIDGRLVAGGTLQTDAASSQFTTTFGVPRFGTSPFNLGVLTQRPGLRIDVQAARGPVAAARLDLSGVADAYDVEVTLGTFALAPVWSNGGRLSVGAGGSIAGARIDADGGDGRPEAEGGVLTWLDPVLRASDTGVRTSNLLGAQQIMAAGFDTLVAQRSLTAVGDVSLTLGRGFYVSAQPFTGLDDPGLYGVSLASSGRLSVAAPYVRLSSLAQSVVASGTVPRGTGTISIDAAAIDVAGAVYVDPTVAAVTLASRGDVRVAGVQALNTSLGLPTAGGATAALSGQLIVNGDLTIRASQLYPVTGTGNLQREIDAQRAGTTVTPATPFLIASTGETATIRIERAAGAVPAAPYAAGGNLAIQAANIVQNGVVRVPVGRLTLGSTTPITLTDVRNNFIPSVIPATASLTFGSTSVTSVSAEGLSIPYGTTTDLTEYFFLATSDQRLFAPPTADLRLAGGAIVVAAGATVDLSGGGDLYAYEFASGVGGSRDVLDRRNTDEFSSRNGLQFPDGRQVYAIVPGFRDAAVSLDDPLYSADYANLFSPVDAGRRVFLEDAPGLPGGWYTLLPARYALLPGGMRIVENTGTAIGAIGVDAALLDGSIVVGGRYGIAGTTFEESRRRSFTVQSQATLRKFSRIELTSATATFGNLATRDGLVVPRLPSDAARLVLNPESELSINTATRFLSSPATGGRGSQVDLVAPVIEITAAPVAPVGDGTLRLSAGQLASLNASSLLIGAVRTDNADGTTALAVGASSIRIANTATTPLGGAELVFAVDGIGSSISFADGATVIANAPLADTAQGNYIIERDGSQSGVGALARIANGPERLVSRSRETAETSLLASSLIVGGSATSAGGVLLSGTSVLLDASRDLVIFDNPATRDIADNRIDARFLALSGDDVMFAEVPSQFRGLTITRAMEQDFLDAERLTISSRSIVGFDARLDRPEPERAHVFNDLRLDVRGIRTYRPGETGPTAGYTAPFPPGFDPALPPLTAVDPQTPLEVTLRAREFALSNDDVDRGTCADIAFVDACGNNQSRLLIDATTVRLGSGPMRTYGFASVQINADAGVLVEGQGFLDVGAANLVFDTPFFGDRALVADPRGRKAQPELSVLTSGTVSLRNSGGFAVPTVAAAPGAILRFGDLDQAVASFSAANVRVRATSGGLSVRSATDIAVTGNSVLEAPGYSRTFGDVADQVTVSATGGTLSLVALNGDLTLGAATRVSVGGGNGEAGTLELSAARGRVTLGGAIDAAAPEGRASLILDMGRNPFVNGSSGARAFDLPAFLAGSGAAFDGSIAIRTSEGDLRLADGQTIRATQVRLTADGGLVDVAGRIDTSGINGGAIGLFGRAGVRIEGTARLDAHADGYGETDTRVASGGTIDIGTGPDGVLTVDQRIATGTDTSRQIDVAARRPGARLVASLAKNPVTLNDETVYRFAESDTGGLVRLRAPLLEIADAPDSVAIDYRGDIFGAREVSIEAVKRYDLAAIANCAIGAVCINSRGQAVLDVNANDGDNVLGGRGPGSISAFARDFDIAGAATRLGALTTLAGYVARPGIEFDHAGDIVLVSNWNFGAGTVDTDAAMRAGLMSDNRALGNGRLTVNAGAEGRVYNEFTDFYYRVGGRAAGAAGVLTLRAGGDLDIRGSITDGFFAFSDQTDPLYVSALLRGGDQLFQPTLNVSCGLAADCSAIGTFQQLRTAPPVGITVNLATLSRGAQPPLNAPYSVEANSPGALGLQAEGAGDPIGSAVLAPRLTDGGAADSFGYRLVAGADLASADPSRVVTTAAGTVDVSGEISYRVIAERGQARYDGDLGFAVVGAAGAVPVDALLATINGESEQDLSDRLSRLLLTGIPGLAQQFVRERARTFFAGRTGQFQFFGPAAAPTLITASLGVMTEFLKFLEVDLAPNNLGYSTRLERGELGYAALPPIAPIPLQTNFAFTRTRVRTGTGAIEIAAARDVDLRNGERPTLRNEFNRSAQAPRQTQAQVGGSAIYTAGVSASLGDTIATESGTGRQLTIDTAAFVNTAVSSANRQRLFNNVLDAAPVYLTGGGAVSVSAGRDILARRDVQGELIRAPIRIGNTTELNGAGAPRQLWRSGDVATGSESGIAGGSTIIGINPQLFNTGIATLGGGNIRVVAGRDLKELTIAADTSVTSGTVTDPARLGTARALATFGGGNVDVKIGRDMLGGVVDVAMGTGVLAAQRAIAGSGLLSTDFSAVTAPAENNLLVRVTDARFTATASQSIVIGDIVSLGTGSNTNRSSASFYTAQSGIALQSNGSIQTLRTITKGTSGTVSLVPDASVIAPASLEAASLFGDLDLVGSVLFPSSTGQLRLFAGGNLAPVTLTMDDGDPSLAPGALSAFSAVDSSSRPRDGLRLYEFPQIYPDTTDTERRVYHNERITHLGDAEPIRIAVDGTVDQLSLSAPKLARISAGVDLIDTMFFGQHLAATDVTRITAGRDIVATSRVLPVVRSTALPVLQGNNFVLGGPGTLFVEAGRDLGPFLNSATVNGLNGAISYAGGILTVGNEYNPWLGSGGAKIYAEFGVAGGANYDALRETYVNPANAATLDGDLFVQVVDANGNPGPDRTRPIYAPILVDYMVANFAPQLRARFGTSAVTPAQAYTVFLTLPPLTQRQFLLDQVYFNELAAPSRPDGPSFNQFVRSYRAVDLLFPASRGYTANDLSGASNGGTSKLTGNLDLRLAAIESSRGGDITILGPGGRVVAGSVVLTAVQAARRGQEVFGRPAINLFGGSRRGNATSPAAAILGIPRGFEGVLTLRGGAIRGFTDGDFLLNQSRVFTQTGGNVTLFSSNGDLNAGQGPRSGANFPPVVLRFTPNGFSEVDSAGAVSGAGIAAFQPRPDVPAPDVILVAPAGTVDAGDAGVRAAGNVFIAAAQVANADAISAGGTITGAGIAGPVDTASAAAASSASAAAAQAVAGVNPANRPDGDRTRITVDVLGFGGDPADDPCNLPAPQRPTNCPVPSTNP